MLTLLGMDVSRCMQNFSELFRADIHSQFECLMIPMQPVPKTDQTTILFGLREQNNTLSKRTFVQE